ncbi:hypothetical protein LTR10_010614 [Elasticomyces elasticus]|nr:hypothetical protein LTR10_010614 [Elasticomyces elasticus]KAK4968220.1 hypothetical protein LTR42_009503 [Elasticomyces elasticus]
MSCYAFLFDVEGSAPLPGIARARFDRASFSRSVWFSRSWTLQELLAPSRVRFFARDWTVIGDLQQLVRVVYVATSIPEAVLRHETAVSDCAIAQRLFWAFRRSAERREDKTYALLGILGIDMPMQYGEGDRAFLRLQEELIIRSRELTILAWNKVGDRRLSSCLFASCPADFASSGGVELAHEVANDADFVNNKGINGDFRLLEEHGSESNVRLLPLYCHRAGRPQDMLALRLVSSPTSPHERLTYHVAVKVLQGPPDSRFSRLDTTDSSSVSSKSKAPLIIGRGQTETQEPPGTAVPIGWNRSSTLPSSHTFPGTIRSAAAPMPARPLLYKSSPPVAERFAVAAAGETRKLDNSTIDSGLNATAEERSDDTDGDNNDDDDEDTSGEEDDIYISFAQSSDPTKHFTIGRVIEQPLRQQLRRDGTSRTFSDRETRTSLHVVVRPATVQNLTFDVIPIKTYNSQGVAARGVVKAHHAVVYTEPIKPPGLDGTLREQPLSLPNGNLEAGMQSPAIHIVPHNETELFDPLSRLYFAETRILHSDTEEVRLFGVVDPQHISRLLQHYRTVRAMLQTHVTPPDRVLIPQAPTGVTMSEAATLRQGQGLRSTAPPDYGNRRELSSAALSQTLYQKSRESSLISDASRPQHPRAQQASKQNTTVIHELVPASNITNPTVQTSDTAVLRLLDARDAETFQGFVRQPSPVHFFVDRRVFMVLSDEPPGYGSTIISAQIASSGTGPRYSEMHAKLRRLVMISSNERAKTCQAIAFQTYGGRGVSKEAVVKADHAIIHNSPEAPLPRTDELPKPGEQGMQPIPIRFVTDNKYEGLSSMLRLDFATIYTISHETMVKPLGMVHQDSVWALQAQFREVHRQRSTRSLQPRLDQLRQSQQATSTRRYPETRAERPTDNGTGPEPDSSSDDGSDDGSTDEDPLPHETVRPTSTTQPMLVERPSSQRIALTTPSGASAEAAEATQAKSVRAAIMRMMQQGQTRNQAFQSVVQAMMATNPSWTQENASVYVRARLAYLPPRQIVNTGAPAAHSNSHEAQESSEEEA